MRQKSVDTNEKRIKKEIEVILQKKFNTVPKEIDFIVNPERGPEYLKEVIFITAKEGFYCQFIYQYAHEYTHHIFDNLYPSKNYHFDWFEEIICEAVSLWILNEFSKNTGFWSLLSNGGYDSAVMEYLYVQIIPAYNKDDTNIIDAEKYYRNREFDKERPHLKITIDLFNKIKTESDIWEKIKSYNATLEPQPPVRPSWLT